MDGLFLNLDRLLRLKNVRQGRAFLLNNGYTQNEVRLLLSKKRKTIKESMMMRLCTTFNCTLNDLYDWNGDAKHPLAAISKQPAPDINQLLAGRSPQEIEEMLKRFEE